LGFPPLPTVIAPVDGDVLGAVGEEVSMYIGGEVHPGQPLGSFEEVGQRGVGYAQGF